MVSALQALSVAIAGTLSGAGWIYLNPFATPANSTIPIYEPPTAHNTSSVPPESQGLGDPAIDGNRPPGEYERLIKPILEWIQPNPIIERELSDADYESLRKGRWLIFVYPLPVPH